MFCEKPLCLTLEELAEIEAACKTANHPRADAPPLLGKGGEDKGQKACAAAFLDAVARGLPAPIPLDEVLEVSRVSIEVAINLS